VTTPRRFPPPWSIEELDAYFVVRDRDGNGQPLAYVYFEDEPGISGKITNQRRGETDCRKYRELPELLSRHRTCGVT